MKKNIAFVTLFDAATTFSQLSIELAGDVDCWFVVPTEQNKKEIISFGIQNERILDVSVRRDIFKRRVNNPQTEATLAFFEDSRLPFVSIIAASRMCNKEPLESLEAYMAETLLKIDAFIKNHNIEWVITEPSDIVQLLAQLVCWKRGVMFGQISLARHPSNRIILITDCTEASFCEFVRPNKVSIDITRKWLLEFRKKNMRPAYYKRISNYRSVFSLIISFLKRVPKIFRELLNLSELNDLRTKQLLTKYVQDLSRKYLKSNNPFIVDELTLKSSKYLVYFLHVQPERSIDVMAPNFVNQIEIIKQLRRSLPWGVDLFVKDHPASDGAQSFRFYSELKKIHGVKLISAQVDSRVLSVNSIAVATVSGTVAYEMALLNKPAIMFSKVFFSSLPSIYIYRTPELLAGYLYKLINLSEDQMRSSDSEIIDFLKKIYESSVASDWDGFYGFLQPAVLSSISDLVRRVILIQKLKRNEYVD